MKEVTVLLLALVVGMVFIGGSWAYIMAVGSVLAELPGVIAAVLAIPAAAVWLAGSAVLWFKLFFGLARMLHVDI